MNRLIFKQAGILLGMMLLMTAACGETVCRLEYAKFGAIPDDKQDDAPALQKALDYLVQQGGGTLEIPSGVYDICSKVKVQGTFDRLCIRGSGQSLSRLVCRNKDGILQIIAENKNAVIEITDMDLPPGIENAGTALELVKPFSEPDDCDYNLLLSNLELKPENMETCYYTHVFIADGWKPLIDSINTSGLYGPKFNTFEGKRKKYLAKSILTLKNAYKPRVQHCNFWAAEYGLVIEMTEASDQPTINQSVSVENAHGILITKIGNRPMSNPVWIEASHWNCAFTGLTLKNVDSFRLVQNCIYGAWDVEDDYKDVILNNCSNGELVDNSFWFGVKPRPNIYVGAQCSNITIRSTFFGRGVSMDPVVIEPGAKKIEVKNSIYETVYAMDEGDTFGLWEMEKSGAGVAYDKNPLHLGRANHLVFSNAVMKAGSKALLLGQALYFSGPDATASATREWDGAPGVRILFHLKVDSGFDQGRSTVLDVPGVYKLHLDNGSLLFTFTDKSGAKTTLAVEKVSMHRDWVEVLAEVDPAIGRAVLEVKGIGGDRRFIKGVELKDKKGVLKLAPVDGNKKFKGGIDQLWIQRLRAE